MIWLLHQLLTLTMTIFHYNYLNIIGIHTMESCLFYLYYCYNNHVYTTDSRMSYNVTEMHSMELVCIDIIIWKHMEAVAAVTLWCNICHCVVPIKIIFEWLPQCHITHTLVRYVATLCLKCGVTFVIVECQLHFYWVISTPTVTYNTPLLWYVTTLCLKCGVTFVIVECQSHFY